MATGAEHYQTAEQHAAHAKRAASGSDMERYCLAAAQVHAALALAAVTAMGSDLGVPEWNAWRKAAGERGGR